MEQITGDKTKQRKLPWRWIIISLVVLVLATGVGVGVRWLQTHNSHKKNTLTTAQQVVSSDNLAQSGDYSAAQQQIADALKQPNLSDGDKYNLYFQQGANYENQGKNQEALDSYKQAADNKQTQDIYESMGRMAGKLGDTQAAINYYKKAIQLIPSSDPVAAGDKASLERDIMDLGGQP